LKDINTVILENFAQILEK